MQPITIALVETAQTSPVAKNPSDAISPSTPIGRAFFSLERVPDLVLRAGRMGFWPLVDQGVVSLGNFLTLVLVARALPAKSEYGTFGLLLEVIFYLNAIQGSLITYPLTVRGAIADEQAIKRLATASLLITCLIALPVVLTGLSLAVITHYTLLGLAGAFALFMWQAQEVVRTALRSRFRFAAAVLGDAIRYLGTPACLFVIWHQGKLTLASVFFSIGTLAAFAIAVQAIQVGLTPIRLRDTLGFAREFWHAGRWLLLTSLTTIIIAICGVWTLSFFHGNAAVGDFYAVANFTKPINPIIMSFAALVTQHAAKALNFHGMPAAKGVALRLSLAACAMTLPFLVLIMLFPDPAMRLLYGARSHFHTTDSVLGLRLFAVGFALFILMNLIGSFLNGVHRTRDSFHAQVVNSVATVAITFPLTIMFGLIGLIGGSALAAAAQLCSMVYFFRRAR